MAPKIGLKGIIDMRLQHSLRLLIASLNTVNSRKSEHQWATIRQPQQFTDDEVDQIAEEFTVLWLAPPPTKVPMPKTLLRPKK